MGFIEISEDEARAQVQRLLESELLRASEPQCRLLSYIAEKSLAGQADHLKEYTVGVDALGKSESYDPQRDSSVRLQASKLRSKLLEYYATVGRGDAVLVEFPKGGFKLVFSRRRPQREPNRSAKIWRRLAISLLAGLLATLCWTVYLLVKQSRTQAGGRARQPPGLEEFWKPFTSGRTVVCVGAPMFLRADRAVTRVPGVDTWEAAREGGWVERLARAFPSSTPVRTWHAFTGLGEAGGVFEVTRVLAAVNPNLQFLNSFSLNWNQISDNQLIFIGPAKFNLQLRDLPVNQDFVVRGPGIENLRPRPGESSFVEDGIAVSGQPEDQSGTTFGLISRLPGLHGRGDILVLAGSWTEGTLAAAKYVTTESYVQDLFRRIRLPDGRLPKHYQVLIRSRFLQQVPVEISYVTHHVLQMDETSADPERKPSTPDP